MALGRTYLLPPLSSGGALSGSTEQDFEEWQAAVEALLLVVELNGPTMMARIGMLRALNRHLVRELNSSRKDTHWGKRKLKRDTA